ncbi:MAG: 16S rRNA (guanine(527)-N(7))-methyltransferase RsmG [Burkholderiaceae bacterium]|jgi:16S rRNA (guanine527-N7)-methyltransferase|nr:16S rRNA (guanine(527)-N(7))-methyltransferase RsmG [Burkholderiaceae bacterium]
MNGDGSPGQLENRLQAGLAELGLTLTDDQQRQLLDYLALLAQWNRVYNLTALRDPAQMLTHHLLDSLAVIAPLRRHLHATGTLSQPVRLLDVGSGGGLPGVVMAICQPEIAVTCVDSVAKKAAFIQQAAGALRLPNLTGRHARVETLAEPFDLITSRAFASLADFTTASRGALAEGGVWLAMKGKRPDVEIAALPLSVEVFHVEQLTVPGLEAERCLVWMRMIER